MKTKQEITPRQAGVLAAIVKIHSENCKPVSSRELIDNGYFNMSGATIRNEMQILEEQGYISHPHTSAGRIPTDEGFRYFVNQLMDRVKLSMKEQETLRREVIKLQAVNAEIGRRLAKVLALHSSQASFTIFPEEVSSTGLSNLLSNENLPSEDAKEIAQFFDNLDDYADEMIEQYGDESAKTIIGKEVTLSKNSDYSIIVSGLQLPSGKKGVIGLVGPKSMKYPKNISLLEYITKLLSGGGGTAAIIIFTYIN